MHAVVKAAYSSMHKLALDNYSWQLEQEAVDTMFKKASAASAKHSIANTLVSESIKVGSMLLESLKNTKAKEDLSKKKYKNPKLDKSAGLSPGKALGYGALASLPLGLTANYAIDKASDEMDAKMYAIPGLAAATVGAILAMRNKDVADSPEKAEELQDALEAKQVLDSVKTSAYSEYTKMSSINTEHIANLISEILVG